MVNLQQLQNTLDADLKVSDSGQLLTSDLSVSEVRSIMLSRSLLKKLVTTESDTLRSEKAVALWLDMNERNKNSFIPDPSSYYEDILHIARDLLVQYLEPAFDGNVLTLNACFDHGNHGPGKSNGVPDTDFVSKMFGRSFSYSDEGLLGHYRSMLNATWRTGELARVIRNGNGVRVTSERMFTVPKDSTIDRVANKQPSLNMFYQLGAGKVLEGVLKKHFDISLKTQPDVNRQLACEGSQSGWFGTIDLKSASDTISNSLVKRLLPRQAYAVLDIIRMRTCAVKGGGRIDLHMFSCMGNGFTFPLQTLLFATLMRACCIAMDIKVYRGDIQNYSVFGDDIICRFDIYDTAVKLLNYCGFIVNETKSYNTGKFRESCGKDYFDGQNVRGVYLKKLSTPQHIYSSFNRLSRWSVSNGIFIANTLRYLRGLVKFLPVPFDVGDDSGLKLPLSYSGNRKVDGNGAVLFKRYAAVSVRRRLHVSPIARYIGSLGTLVLQQRARGWVTGLNGCPSGELSESATDREFSLFYVGLRQENPTYKVIKDLTPSWDWIPDPGLTIRGYITYVAAPTSYNL